MQFFHDTIKITSPRLYGMILKALILFIVGCAFGAAVKHFMHNLDKF